MGVAASAAVAFGYGICTYFSSKDTVEESKQQRDIVVSKIDTNHIPMQSQQASKHNYPKLKHKKFDLKNINIAIIGNSGQGKSSFINAYFHKSKKDKDYAKVGITETTVDAQPFEYKVGGNKIIFWDLPGCGTNKFPFDTYIKDFGLPHFDVCIIISANRYKETDDELAYQLDKFAHMPIYIIRSKFDSDLDNYSRENCNLTRFEDLSPKVQDGIHTRLIYSLEKNLKEKFKKSYNIIKKRFFILSSMFVSYTGRDWITFNKCITMDLLNCRQQNKKLKLEAEKRAQEFDQKLQKRVEKEKKLFKAKRNSKTHLEKHKKKEFKRWLKDVDRKEEYLNYFEENDCADMQTVVEFDDTDLQDLGITKRFIRKKYLKGISNLNLENKQFTKWLKENELIDYKVFLDSNSILTLSSFDRLLKKIKIFPDCVVHQTIPSQGFPPKILKIVYQKLNIVTDFDFDQYQTQTPGQTPGQNNNNNNINYNTREGEVEEEMKDID
jgi:signal recognition particle receptor subunit beta